MTDTLRHQLDELARHAPAPRWPHDVAAEQAWRRGRRLLVPAPLVAAVLVCSLVLVGGLVGALAIVRRTPVQPAQGPGALPARLVAPPVGTPLVTEQPVARAAYVIAGTDLRRGTFSRGNAPVVVSADDGQYRVVPWRDGDHGISLSPDGRRLAWVRGDGPRFVTRTVVLTLATGELREVPGAPTAAQGTAWSDDGNRLLVWGSTRVSENTAEGGRVEVRDATSLKVLARDAERSGPAAMVSGQLIVPTEESGTTVDVVSTEHAVVSPDGRQTAQVVLPEVGGTPIGAKLLVHSADRAVDSFTPVVWLDVAYAEALAWVSDGIVVAEYAGADRRGPAQVAVLDPSTGTVVRTLTTLPADAGLDLVVDVDPQVVAVAGDVLMTGQVTETRPRAWPWHSAERVRWWLSDPLVAGLQLGLGVLALVVVLGLVRLVRRPMSA